MSWKRSRSAVARKLQNLGIPVGYQEQKNSSLVLIRQSGSITENSVFPIKDIATGVILSISITSDLSSLAISGFELGLSWSDPNFKWLDDPAENPTARSWKYCFPFDKHGFDHSIVLNHTSKNRKVLQRGHSIEGLLLGFGDRKIPPELQHGGTVPAFLTVVDQIGERYSSEVSLWVERSAARDAANPAKPKRKPLFEVRDPVDV